MTGAEDPFGAILAEWRARLLADLVEAAAGRLVALAAGGARAPVMADRPEAVPLAPNLLLLDAAHEAAAGEWRIYARPSQAAGTPFLLHAAVAAGQPPVDLVAAVYRAILGREADAAGRDAYADLVGRGWPVPRFLQALAQSAEGERLGETFLVVRAPAVDAA